MVVHHTVDGEPDEWLYRRDPALGFTVRNPVPGQVVDISAGGLGIKCQRPLNLRHEYPFSLAAGATMARVRGTIRWCKLVGTSWQETGEPAPIYRMGVEILRS